MEAAAKPLMQKYGWVRGVLLLLPIKLLVMPFNDRVSVCPLNRHAARMRCRSFYIKGEMCSRRITPFLPKLFAMPSKEGVKPHQKLISVGPLIGAAKNDYMVRFFLSVQAR